MDVNSGIKTQYVACFRGPILLSAPHSSRIMRGGTHTKTKERLHLREQWVSTLTLKLAIAIEELQKAELESPKESAKAIRASVLFWNKDKKFDKYTLDPNYLVKAQFRDSNFHQSLHRFIETQAGIPSKAINHGHYIQ